MKQSGMPSWRHAQILGPIKLTKSQGQFTTRNILLRKNESVDGFTPDTCLDAGSRERPYMIHTSCNVGQCPGGYGLAGYEPGETWHYSPPCWMKNMVCVKNNYDTTTDSVVANCCNGISQQKDCDPSLCKNSKMCRDKMERMCNKQSTFGNNQCQTWLNASENADKKAEILPRYCFPESLADGPCRAFAQSTASHGLMDDAVKQWCTPGTIKLPNSVDQKTVDFARWQTLNTPQPSWWIPDFMTAYALGNVRSEGEFRNKWQVKMLNAINNFGLAEVQNPTTRYRDNSKDPICACYLSPLNKYGDKTAPPSCFDAACTMGGYQTGGQKLVAQRCPSLTECRSSIMAASGGSNKEINVQQICGGPPIEPSPNTAILNPLVPPADDKARLLEDEKRGGATPPKPPTVEPPTVEPPKQESSWRDQLQKPFAPDLLGDTSIESVAVLFFAIIIISAILWRMWSDKKRQKFQEALQMEQFQIALDQPSRLEPNEAQMAVQGQLSQMPRVA